MGKSVATIDLLKRLSKRFKLVIAMVGTPSCQPALHAMMEQHWDPRFFFETWDVGLVKRLMKQQESLRAMNIERHVAILVDDVVLTSEAAEQISHCAMRGRHWLISLFMCGVSWSTLPKRVRRSLDICMVFSCPMASDVKLLTSEYATNSSMAEFMMKQLEPHQCLVLETVTKTQRLFVWTATLWTREMIQKQSSQDREKSKNAVSRAIPSEIHDIRRREDISFRRGRTESLESAGPGDEEQSK